MTFGIHVPEISAKDVTKESYYEMIDQVNDAKNEGRPLWGLSLQYIWSEIERLRTQSNACRKQQIKVRRTKPSDL